MLRAVLHAHGPPEDGVRLEEVAVPEPGPEQIRVRVLASPVDPADLLVIHGSYAVLPELPFVPGMEGAGVVEALGPRVSEHWLGKSVLLPIRSGAWQQQVVVAAAEAFELPDGIDPIQASMLRINPPTAALLLREVAAAEPDQWILQSPGSGAVGQLVVQLARAMGVRTVSVVRSEAGAERVRGLGGDVAIVGMDGLRRGVAAATHGAPLAFAFDGVGGGMTQALARCLAPGGTVVAYGAVSRRPSELAVSETVFRGVSLRGFWLFRWNQAAGRAVREALLGELATQVAAGRLVTQIAAAYPLPELARAISAARAPERSGRVMLLPQMS